MENNTGILHDTSEIVPVIGMTGLYSLKSPYTDLINSDIEYTCVSVSSISGMLANGLNPLNEIYIANGDTEVNYNLDAENNRTIITLQSGIGDVVTVPNSALNKLPIADGVNYTSVMLGVMLSVIPDSLDLTTLEQEIKDLVLSKIGVNSTITSAVLGGSIVIPHDKHAIIEIARLGKIISGKNNLLDNIKLQDIVSKQAAKIALLEAFVKTKL